MQASGFREEELSASEVVEVRPGAMPAGERALALPDAGEVRDAHLRSMAGRFLDAAAVRLAAAREIIPAWTAELLHRFEQGRGYLQLGRSCMRDYAREDLGLTTWQLRDLRQLGRSFARFPSLRGALLEGRATTAQVRRLIPVIESEEDVERWLGRLAAGSARELAEEVREEKQARREARPGRDCSDEEPARRLTLTVEASRVASWHLALELGRQLEGPARSPFDVCEMMALEWLAQAPPATDEPDAREDTRAKAAESGAAAEAREVSSLRRDLEQATNRWEFLSWERPRARLAPEVAAEVTGDEEERPDPGELDRRLRYLLALERQLDWQMGRVLSTALHLGVPRQALFASFDHYVQERLGMSPRRAFYLVRIHRDLRVVPVIDEAFREGSLTWQQARTLARVAEDGWSAETARAWLARAQAVTAARLAEDADYALALRATNPRLWHETLGYPPLDQETTRAEVEPPDFVRDCPGYATAPFHPGPLGTRWPAIVPGPRPRAAGILNGGSDLDVVLVGPASGIELIEQALHSAAAALTASGQDLSRGAALGLVIEHFLAQHETEELARMRRRYRVFERDGWRCQMPGCRSGSALHSHHIVFRSHGGSDDDENRLILCHPCHERVVHGGHARIRRDGDGRVWITLLPGAGEQASTWVGERRADHCGPGLAVPAPCSASEGPRWAAQAAGGAERSPVGARP